MPEPLHLDPLPESLIPVEALADPDAYFLDDFEWDPDEEDIEQAEERSRNLLGLLFLLVAFYAAHRFGLKIDAALFVEYADEFARRQASLFVGQINETTVRVVARLLERAKAERWTIEEFLVALESSSAFGDSRALLIALDQSIRTRNAADGLLFKVNGITYVRISDGVKFDRPCREANGQRWTVDQYLANPLEHLHCVRAATPILPASARPSLRLVR